MRKVIAKIVGVKALLIGEFAQSEHACAPGDRLFADGSLSSSRIESRVGFRVRSQIGRLVPFHAVK
jgi:hypothetical protein